MGEADKDIARILDRFAKNLQAYRAQERDKFAQENFLHFGMDGAYPGALDLDGTADLLSGFDQGVFASGMSDMTRSRAGFSEPVLPDTHYCDFCGRPLIGGAYDKLADGRERCTPCSRTVVRRAGEARNLFRTVKRQMEISYGISFSDPIDATIVSSKKLHARLGETFTPTPGEDGRMLGFVVVKRGRQELWLENGSPRAMIMSCTAHELTHVWQNQFDYYMNLPRRVSDEARLLIVEGMATWSEVQFLKLVHEEDYAQVKIDEYHRREDVYGLGFQLYEERFGFSEGGSIVRDNPFAHPEGSF